MKAYESKAEDLYGKIFDILILLKFLVENIVLGS